VILTEPSTPKSREPIFNVPAAIVATVAVLMLVHAARIVLLTDEQDVEFVLAFGFIPARYGGDIAVGSLPGGFGADLWSFFTYAFIHADWTHLGLNLLWLVPFGSAVARRFGTSRFLGFFAVTAAAGALAHLLGHGNEDSAVVGASAAISGTMAGAMRFAFQRGGPLGFWGERDEAAYQVPALPLAGVVREPRVMIFLIVWFGINLLFGMVSLPIGGNDQPVAWEAHIGGFVAGLVLFSLFDPARSRAN
jgi:membrane associated rhomboid family serine protease